jgi:hypothetical protein
MENYNKNKQYTYNQIKYSNKEIQCWKWSLGESYYKSARPAPEKKQEKNTLNTNDFDLENFDSTFQQYNAINQSLEENYLNNQFINDNNNDNELIGITNSVFSRNQLDNQISKREDLDTRIADREMLAQRGVNPFLNSSNYVDDIFTRDNFLKPINTSIGKPVETNN